MKILRLLSFIALILFLFPACKKDWKCTCNVSGSYYGLGTQYEVIKHAKEEDASKKCKEFGESLNSPYGPYNCSIAEQ